jgi:uncharacterized protein YbjT (DUF2867 family)
MIFVSGATGNVGGELVEQLAASGTPVRALVRRPDAALPAGVEPVLGDLGDPDSVVPALRGVTAAFVLAGYGNLPALLERMHQAGVERVVLLSGGGAEATDLDNVISRWQVESERAVRASGLTWTILRPYAFMTNTFRWLPQLRAGDVVRLPFAEVATAVIDPYDIAAVAAASLLQVSHGDRVYRLSGPAALLPAEQVAILGAGLGRQLRFEALSDDEARADMATRMPAEYVEAFFGFSVRGTLDESRVLSTVAEVTGTPPRTLSDWVARHADAFRH